MTELDIQTWIDSYKFIDNKTTSKDVLLNVVSKLENHQYMYGPIDENNYQISISGPVINKNFIIKTGD
jgi:hypothetical protein